MKKIFTITLLLTFFCLLNVTAQQKWYNPETSEINPLEGQFWQGEKRASFYNRLPDKYKEDVRQVLWNLSTNSAGESVLFRTNSKNITVRYTLLYPKYVLPHMPQTGSNGLDLYAHDSEGNNKRVVGTFHFSDTCTYTYSMIDYRNASHSKGYEYQLFLPAYNGINSLEIGVEEDAYFEFVEPRKEKPIVVYGTSIAHGACASRPGMIWTSILSRKLDIPIYNYGFSGNGRLEDALIEMIAEIDAKMYILDCMPNLQHTPSSELTALIIKQVKRLRELRPNTPILLTDHIGYSHSKTSESFRKFENNAILSQKAAVDKLKKEGIENIFYLDFKTLNMPSDAYVDHIHPSDLGMQIYADEYEKIIRSILSMPKGEGITTTAVRQRREPRVYEWLDRHNKIIEESKNTEKKGAFLGNSIFHHWGGVEGFRVQRATEVWDENFSSYINMGCGWDKIENVLWRVERGALDFNKFDTVILKIGTNNLSVKHSDEQILLGLSNLIEAIHLRQQGAKIIVAGILPRRDMESRIKNLNIKIKQLAEKHNYTTYKDLSKGLLLPNGKIDEKMFTDGLHPNMQGYKKIAISLKQ